MCGIAGAIGSVDAAVIAASRRTSEAQRLRGPDSDGQWASGPADAAERGGAFLAFRRLKIIDLSDGANQPMVDGATGNALVFNGEIYNFRLLRTELERLGRRFRTSGDAEVVLQAYAQWGHACVPRLRGMFAFVLWDAAKRQALMARDRIGIKPLYYAPIARPGGRRAVLFASQVRALLTGGLIERRLDPVALSTFIWNGFVVGPGTMVKGVRLLPAGCTATVTCDGQVAEARYWTIPAPNERRTGVDGIKQALEETVAQHLVSDVPLGIFLSGGRDSSAVTAIAARVSPSRIKTFTITFDEARYNEADCARRVAQLLKTDHHEVPLSERTFKDQLPDALTSIDQPTFDAINTYFVSRAVRAAGLTVAMAGTGGDELFGGYRSFRDLPAIRRRSRRAAMIPRWVTRPAANAFARIQAGSTGSVPPQTRWGKFADALESRGNWPALYQVAYSLFTTEFARRLLPNSNGDLTQFGLPTARAAELDSLTEGRTDLDAVSAMEMSMFLGERLLRDTDAASMEVSLEVRVPLLDHEVIEAVIAVDDVRRFQPIMHKSLLHEAAMPDLPESLFDRPKAGFELPLDVWCRKGLRASVGGTLTDAAACEAAGLSAAAVADLWRAYDGGAPGLYWSRVWGLFVLLWWCREHGVMA